MTARVLDKPRRWILAGALLAAILGPAVTGFLTAPAAFAQQGNSFVGLATSAERKFEVATIKPSDPDDPRVNRGAPQNGGMIMVNVSLRDIITLAFRTTGNLVFGGPDWIGNTNYDLTGKGPDPKAISPEVWAKAAAGTNRERTKASFMRFGQYAAWRTKAAT